MSWFQLDPISVVRRIQENARITDIPTLTTSVWRGMIGFTLVSVAGFVPWAVTGGWFYRHVGEAGLYAICAAVFIGSSGCLLHRLIIGSGSLVRFYKLFGISFATYSAAWIAGWMSLRGHPGSLAGLFAGTAIMGFMLARAFDAASETVKAFAALFLLNSFGYFIGGWVEGAVIGLKQISPLGESLAKPTQVMIAKLLWGVCYGFGFGAGLGVAFHFCQTRTRALLISSRDNEGVPLNPAQPNNSANSQS